MLLFVAAGCVERTMTLESNPPGALVYLNDQEIGRTPLEHDFLWYGNYDVQIRKEGFETADTNTKVWAPWWQWVPFDLVADLLPVRLKDKHTYTYSLRPASTQPVDAGSIMSRGEKLRGQFEALSEDKKED